MAANSFRARSTVVMDRGGMVQRLSLGVIDSAFQQRGYSQKWSRERDDRDELGSENDRATADSAV